MRTCYRVKSELQKYSRAGNLTFGAEGARSASASYQRSTIAKFRSGRARVKNSPQLFRLRGFFPLPDKVVFSVAHFAEFFEAAFLEHTRGRVGFRQASTRICGLPIPQSPRPARCA